MHIYVLSFQQWIGKVWINLLCTPEVSLLSRRATHKGRIPSFRPVFGPDFELLTGNWEQGRGNRELGFRQGSGTLGPRFCEKKPAFGIPFLPLWPDLSMTNLQNRLLCLCLSIWLADTSPALNTRASSSCFSISSSRIPNPESRVPHPSSLFSVHSSPVDGVNNQTGFGVPPPHIPHTFLCDSLSRLLIFPVGFGCLHEWMKGKAQSPGPVRLEPKKSSADKRKLASVLASIETIIKHSCCGSHWWKWWWSMGVECPFWTTHSH